MITNRIMIMIGDSKDTKESTVPVKTRRRETWTHGDLL